MPNWLTPRSRLRNTVKIMRIKVSEVWNHEGRTETLATIDVDTRIENPKAAVYTWMAANRPDLSLATTIDAHGFHAIAVH